MVLLSAIIPLFLSVIFLSSFLRFCPLAKPTQNGGLADAG